MRRLRQLEEENHKLKAQRKTLGSQLIDRYRIGVRRACEVIS